jgi:hypothetical protein
MAKTITPDDVDVFLGNAAWAICSTYHTFLKASPGAAVFELDMLFNTLFIADWNNIEITGNARLILVRRAKITSK